MSVIIQTQPWNELDLANCYPLHKACKDGDPQMVNALLQANRNLALVEDRFCGWTPIHWAAYFGKLDCLRIAVSALNNGANLQTSKLSQTAAHCSAEAGHSHCLLWLLQAGANPNLKDFHGETPLHKCSRTGNAECVSLLVESSCDVRTLNNSGELASTLAEKHGFPAISTYIHQAELARELGCKPSISEVTPFNMNRNFCNGLRSFAFPNGTGVRINRKRSFTDMNNNDNIMKRIRFEAPAFETTQNMDMMTSVSVPCETSSVVEHEKLCRVEEGYSNIFFKCLFSEFHGN